MPVLAIVAAVVAVSEAVAVTATVWSTITAIGAVAGAIGAVTGNKDLMKIGAVVGIAGAVGGFADGAGFFGDTGSVTGATADVANNAAADSMIGANNAGSAVSSDIGSTFNAGLETPQGMIGNATPDVSVPPPDATATLPPPAAPAVTPDASQVPGATPPLPGTSPPAQSAPSAADQITANAAGNPQSFTDNYQQDPGASSAPVQPGLGQSPNANPLAPQTPFDTLMAGFGKLGSATSDFAKANPMLATSIFQGVASAADPSQRNLRDAQTQAYGANTAHTAQLTKNMNGVGGPIDWNKVFKPPTGTGMIARGGK